VRAWRLSDICGHFSDRSHGSRLSEQCIHSSDKSKVNTGRVPWWQSSMKNLQDSVRIPGCQRSASSDSGRKLRECFPPWEANAAFSTQRSTRVHPR
jgi:hypothetical protein